MRTLLIIARASGLMLVASAVLKMIDAREVAGSFNEYFHLPGALALAAVIALCTLECGLGSWAMLSPRRAAPLLMVLFAIFTGWHIGFRLLIGDGSCPCFGRLTLFGTEGPQVAFAPALAAITAVHFAIAVRTARTPRLRSGGDNPGAPGTP